MTEVVPLGHQLYRLLHSLTYICERKGAGRAMPEALEGRGSA